jgi:hypothetical protein
MKMRLNILTAFLALVLLGSCTKNEIPVFTKAVIEFDAASWNNNATGRTYPILTRVPGYNRAAVATDPALTRTNPGVKKFRVNLLGKQFTTPTTIYYDLYPFDGGSTAVEGVHYRMTKNFTIPANSSFGELEVEILNPGAQTGVTSVDLLLLLVGNNGIETSANYRIIGLRIAQ